jgi:hypothetical protein
MIWRHVHRDHLASTSGSTQEMISVRRVATTPTGTLSRYRKVQIRWDVAEDIGLFVDWYATLQ